jgi:hypothetical protein
MNDYWKTIPGYFCPWYEEGIPYIIPKLPSAGIILELGSAYGKSTCYWAEQLIKHDKNYDIITVDNWSLIVEKIHPVFKNLKEGKKIGKAWGGNISKIILQECTSKENLLKLQNCYLYNSPTMAELFAEYTEPYKSMITILNIDIYKEAQVIPANIQCVFDDICSEYQQWFSIIYDKLEVGGYYIFNKNAIFKDKEIMDYLNMFLAEKGIEIQNLLLKNTQSNVSEIKYFIKTTK